MRATPLICAALLLLPSSLPAQSRTSDKDLAAGVRAGEEGDVESAITTLDGVVKRLSADKTRSKEPAQGYLYLAIPYLQLSQEASPTARFVDAIASDQEL